MVGSRYARSPVYKLARDVSWQARSGYGGYSIYTVDLAKLFRYLRTSDLPVTQEHVSALENQFSLIGQVQHFVQSATRTVSPSIGPVDLSVPVVLIRGVYGDTVVDGRHRVDTAKREGVRILPVVVIPAQIARSIGAISLRPHSVSISRGGRPPVEGAGISGSAPYFWEQVRLRSSHYASHEEEIEVRMGIDTFATHSAISKGLARRLKAKRTGFVTVREFGGLIQHPTTTLWTRVRGCGAAYRPVEYMVADSELNVLGIQEIRECGLLTRPMVRPKGHY